MSMEHHFVVARDSVTGTWFTVDMTASMEGNIYNTDTEEWGLCETDEMVEFDDESFAQLSHALDVLNAARKVTA